ncbi:MAG: hypothetical protein RJA81_714 [Planctomycetota bacterium]
MKRRTFLRNSALLSAGAMSGSLFSLKSAVAQDIPSGYTPLFNGKDLSGWYGVPHFDPRKLHQMTEEELKAYLDKQKPEFEKHWTVENGELVNDGFGPYATSEKHFRDYDFVIDYKTVAKADSGIYLKANPQVQIWDYTEEAKFNLGADKGSGGLWNNSKGAPGKDPMVLADKPFGEWNRFRIQQVGARTSVWLNDKMVVDNAIMENFWDRSAPLFVSGPFQLQTHGGEIRWKNIAIREYNSEEANAILRGKTDPDGFTKLFDGSSLDAWQGAAANYEIRDGAIACKKGKGGVLHTKEKYGDFVARVEIKLPPGGNNGLAIRYPGTGDPAYSGMCELQVLDDGHEKYKKIDARQAHGSAYGMVPAARGFLRPAGEWNYQEVTVKGSSIKVELNGSVILNTDLKEIKEFMANSPHPGKDLAEGFFGFAGHGDDVMFRNVAIKKI